MVDSEVLEYKRKITNKLVSISDIFTYIKNESITTPGEMVGKNIYSFMKVPDPTVYVKNYICFNYSSITSTKNSSFKNCSVTIGVVCHEDDIKTTYGNRHDVLAAIITENFNWSNFLGFELELVSDVESIQDNKYHARTLKFVNKSQNSLKNKVIDYD
jgi:hypothetical protein